jgi:geranylgeranyl diphosphate synthase type I
MRYHLGWEDESGQPGDRRGGKLLRPALCLLCCEAAGGEVEAALPAAAALELLHNFTLIHDDVEDVSTQRHGRQTLWRLRGEAQAINAGDGMFALAHETLLRLSERGLPAERVLRAVSMFDAAALRLCEGQHLDLAHAGRDHVTPDEYLAMIEGKTAALLAASCGIGALLGGASKNVVEALYEFGRRLGLAFQVCDDELGIWGDPSETGKPAGEDLRNGKKSYPVVAGLARASDTQRAELIAVLSGEPGDAEVSAACELLEQLGARAEGEREATGHAEAAVSALSGVDLAPERRSELEQLARFSAERRA